ncbi:MAG: hypothetical protein AB7S65_05255 [Sulfuricurvum sp.]
MHEAVVIALTSPVQVGIYENGKLIEAIRDDGVSSDALARIFDPLLKQYRFERLIYAKGPGSFMGIKVTYLFLKTLSLVHKIPLEAEDAFFFNENCPIKAVGKLYFVKNSSKITLENVESPEAGIFSLPESIEHHTFDADPLPYYGIDAVG